MFKYYLNPFRPLFLELTEDEGKVTLNSLKLTYLELLSVEDLKELLDVVYLTQKCFGKFQFYNKWLITEAKLKDKNFNSIINVRLNYCAMKVANKCAYCKLFSKCSQVNLTRDDLITFWDEIIFKTKASLFRKGQNDTVK